jgi:hypothetical protein
MHQHFSDMVILDKIGIGGSPGTAATSPDGKITYASAFDINKQYHITAWNSDTQQEICRIPTKKNGPDKMMIDSSGEHLFTISEGELYVYSTAC